MTIDKIELARELFAFMAHLKDSRGPFVENVPPRAMAQEVASYIANRERDAMVATIMSDLITDEGRPMVDDDPEGHA